ncbi:CLUMA_CG017458, isoform A [Clunio marinus]|uniref:glutathione transferase n=1 Tax=Clunio marinus TaxID=568069 RepID=A0A1J1IVY1_9DIPT|nr:CLUMA_CG017458, isoform A [Clunio marinus]
MKLYYDLLSQPSRAIYIFLKLNKIPFESNVVKLGRLQHLKSSFKDINRFKRVPCIVDNDFHLAESVAIFRYIVATNPTIADHWYPKDAKERARVDEYLEWQHNNTRVACAGYFRVAYMLPLLQRKPPSKEKINKAKGHMVKVLDLIEDVWLQDESKRFLATNEISFADLMAACEIEQPRIANYNPFEGRPNLTKWYEQVKLKTNPVYDDASAYAYNLIGTMDRSRLYKILKLFLSYRVKYI